jgi:hypothetical protein
MAEALSQKRAGKGVSWSEDEVMALCHAAHIVGSNPVRGANMKKEDYANAIKGNSFVIACDRVRVEHPERLMRDDGKEGVLRLCCHSGRN